MKRIVWRAGYRPSWEPWHGHWWLWIGPYILNPLSWERA